MKVAVIPIVIGSLRTFPKELEKGLQQLEIGERIKNIQTTTLPRSARIPRSILEARGDLLSLRIQ